MNIATLITFIVYLAALLIIGLIAYRMTNNLSDYVLGGRRLGGGVAALSAGASDLSGWLLLGLPGALYAFGMSEMWIGVGLAIGAYINWQFVAKRLRIYTEVAGDSITLPDYFENRFHDRSKVLRILSAVFILLFFAFYTSAGLVGGAILFENSFGLEYTAALWIGAVVIISYTFLGGFLAVSWTDFFQGILMFLAIIIVPIVAVSHMGGWSETMGHIGNVDPTHLDAFSGMTLVGIISLLAWGLGYFGQPHIITRFMAVKSSREIPKARLVGMTWLVISLVGAMFVGLVGIAYFESFTSQPLNDPETVFIAFTQVLFHPIVAGFLLAAILSAIMSTIDSQLLVSSSALTEDFYKSFLRKSASQKELVLVGRLGVVLIALIAIALAYNPDSTVLDLVAYAWGGFGAAFGPVIILSLFWKRMTRNGAAAGIVVGGLTVILWANLDAVGLTGGIWDLYEIVPGFVLGWAAIMAVSLIGEPPSREIQEEFDSVKTSNI
ncbi:MULTISPECIES: sodium/proline symporter PutP [Alteribacter]|uniref:Sodium/proline symporter n=1 Tax=Alteribacter keqinensis TaxID=2483800 RepID=A0A3M7TUJ3_9BACI|nr:MULTISPECIES: sodium/proline symporter PutP [Alteribacter]MBM7094463.1 sodium/proline symporter PutP [Alteribacter salitolerans]RNA69318.1 sodium/proline symporter PutP [Alteribacter keqinensis]